MKTNFSSKLIAVIFSLTVLFCVLSPITASAQTAPATANASANAATGSGSSGAQPNNAPNTCSIGITSFNLNFTACIWIPLMGWLGSLFLTAGGAALIIAGIIFDWLIQYVVIQFGTTLTTYGILTAINTGWTVFRDLSNIVIIGMFTFIAIATILGNTEYGYKKMLSRVLIVAVLINFSLLFSKIIIDTGNYAAYQIYSAISNSQQFQPPQGSTSQFDIASAFMRPMGITSIWNTNSVVQQFGQTTNSGVQAFLFGLVGGLLLLGLSVVLFYGCFLIFARAITLIIVMITASIAFASYLHPRFSESEFGWKGWWKALVNASLFGPLLMIFLYISLLIVTNATNAVQTAGGSASANGGIGATVFTALSNPSQSVNSASGWGVILIYLLGIGLLFISLRLSSAFATSVSGLNIGQGAWNSVAGSTMNGLFNSGRFFGQQTGGRAAYRKEREYQNKAQDLNAQAKAAFSAGDTAKFDRLTKQMNAASKNSLRFGALGAGYKKQVQEKAKKVADVVQRAQVPGDEREKQAREAQTVADIAKSNADKLTQGLKETQKASADSAKAVNDELMKEIQNGNESLKKSFSENQSIEIGKVTDEHNKKLGQIDNRIQELKTAMSGSGSDGEKQRIQKQILETEESRKSEMRHQDERLEKAQRVAVMNTANGEAAKEMVARNEVLKVAAKRLTISNAEEDSTTTLIQEARNIHQNTPSRDERQETHRASTDAMVGVVTNNKDVATETRKLLKTDRENGNIKRLVNSLKADLSPTDEKKTS